MKLSSALNFPFPSNTIMRKEYACVCLGWHVHVHGINIHDYCDNNEDGNFSNSPSVLFPPNDTERMCNCTFRFHMYGSFYLSLLWMSCDNLCYKIYLLKLCYYRSMVRSLNQSLRDLEEFLSPHVHGIVMVNALLVV